MIIDILFDNNGKKMSHKIAYTGHIDHEIVVESITKAGRRMLTEITK